MISSAMADNSNKILSYIPQRPPFVMISNLIKATPKQFETDFFVHPDNIFIADDILTEAALVENIAQTCACGFGYLDAQSDEEPKVGFIGSISKLKVHQLPPVNSRIHTKVTVTFQLGNIFVVEGENFLKGKKLLECEMKIVVQ